MSKRKLSNSKLIKRYHLDAELQQLTEGMSEVEKEEVMKDVDIVFACAHKRTENTRGIRATKEMDVKERAAALIEGLKRTILARRV